MDQPGQEKLQVIIVYYLDLEGGGEGMEAVSFCLNHEGVVAVVGNLVFVDE